MIQRETIRNRPEPAQLISLQMVRPAELAKLLGVSRTSLWAWRKAKTFPAPVRLGSCVAWKLEDVSRFLDERKAVSDGRR
jgi:predicted DNA-binding transcriptional regulator AlpA